MLNYNLPLTEAESEFAAEHHSVIYGYLRKAGLPEDEAARDLMLSALEQSILSLGGVDEVQFLIEGSAEPDGYR